ncbi:unnamed protein product [Pylaiella littoralis]
MDSHQGAARSREKRPRDCQQNSQDSPPPPENRGGAREGSGRPKGSYGPKRIRTLLHKYEAFLRDGMAQSAHEATRDISAAKMLAAAVAVEKILAELTRPYLKSQANTGVGRKSAIRKLAKKRSQWENAAIAAKACREGWSSGVEYFERVQEECLGATAAATGHDAEQPLDDSHAQAGKLMLQAVALKGVYEKLLLGWSARVVFEEMAGLLAVGVSTVKQWEKEYRQKGHIE